MFDRCDTLPELLSLLVINACVYKIFVVHLGIPAFKARLSERPDWASLALKKGAFCVNAQEEVPFTMLIGLHHVVGGLMCVYGGVNNSPAAFACGAMVEVGFELADILSVVTRQYPYNGAIKEEIRKSVFMHHAPGLLAGIPMLSAGLAESANVQMIVASLMLAGGLSVMIQSAGYLLSSEDQKVQAVVLQILGFSSLVLARAYVFPVYTYELVLEMRSADQHFALVGVVLIAASLMFRFNLTMLRLNYNKTHRMVCDLLSVDEIQQQQQQQQQKKQGARGAVRVVRRTSSSVRRSRIE